MTPELEEQIAAIEQEVKTSKEQNRELKQKYLRDEATWKNEHTRMVELQEKIRNLKGKKEQEKKDIELSEKKKADIAKYHAVVAKSNRTEEAKHRREIADAHTRVAQFNDHCKPKIEKLKNVTTSIKEKENTIKELKTQIRQLQLKQSQLAPHMKFKSKSKMEISPEKEVLSENRPKSLMRHTNASRSPSRDKTQT